MTKEYSAINEFFHSTETAELQPKINYTDYRLIIILIIVIKQTIWKNKSPWGRINTHNNNNNKGKVASNS